MRTGANTSIWTLVLSLVIGVLTHLSAQTPGLESGTGIILRSTTKLVEVNVVVRDKQGGAVTNLRKEDFEVFDSGKPQSISLFVTEREPAAPPSLSPNVFSNRVGMRESGGYAVVLLDWLNTGWVDQAQARDQVIRMLRQIRLEDKVALFVLDRGLRIVHDFTSDTAHLLEKLAPLRGQAAAEAEGRASSIFDAGRNRFEADVFGSAPSGRPEIWQDLRERIQAQDLRILDTLAAFEQVAAHLAGVPGRKSLIWISAGFPTLIDSTVIRGASAAERTYSEQIDRAIRKLNDADVAVYAVDARGLPVGGRGFIGTLQEFASRTGGHAFYNRNDLETGIRAGLDDLHASYTLGYYVPEPVGEGFRRIRVRVNRPGLHLRHRQGYFTGSPRESSAREAQASVTRALRSPVDATGIPLTLHVDRQQDTLQLRIVLNPETLALEQTAGRWIGSVDLLTLFMADDGSQSAPISSQTAGINLTQKAYEEALTHGGLSFRAKESIPPSATRLRVLVRDSGSDALGSVTIRLREILISED